MNVQRMNESVCVCFFSEVISIIIMLNVGILVICAQFYVYILGARIMGKKKKKKYIQGNLPKNNKSV